MGINYAHPEPNDDYDVDMVLSLKELLGYALQISYGLVGPPCPQPRWTG